MAPNRKKPINIRNEKRWCLTVPLHPVNNFEVNSEDNAFVVRED